MATSGVCMDDRRALDLDHVYRTFRDTGYVVFERAIGRDLVEAMYAVWEEYFASFQQKKPQLKRLLMHLPFRAPLYHPSFVENPLVMPVVDRLLGPKYICGYFGSETPLPGADYMDWHFDLAFWTKFRFLNPGLSFVNKLLGSLGYYYGIHLSMPLVDCRAENAPFEIWPRTNRLSLTRREPQVLTLPAGSLIVRDIRNLHRGTPHRGDRPRPFLSLVYLKPWVPRWRPPEIPTEVFGALPPRSRALFAWAAIGHDVPDPEAWAVRSR